MFLVCNSIAIVSHLIYWRVSGVAPPSVVMIQAGQTLYKLTSYGDTFTWGYFGLLAFFALLSLLPVIFKKKLREKFD